MQRPRVLTRSGGLNPELPHSISLSILATDRPFSSLGLCGPLSRHSSNDTGLRQDLELGSECVRLGRRPRLVAFVCSLPKGACCSRPPSMKRRPSQSTDDDAESSLESDSRDDHVDPPKRLSTRRASSARSSLATQVNWKQTNGSNGYTDPDTVVDSKTLPRPSSTSVHSSTKTMVKDHMPIDSHRPRRGIWSISRLAFITALMGIVILSSILGSFFGRPSDPKGCRMSYMRPSYVRFSEFDTEHTRFATKYSLYLYREQGIDDAKSVSGRGRTLIRGDPCADSAAASWYSGAFHPW